LYTLAWRQRIARTAGEYTEVVARSAHEALEVDEVTRREPSEQLRLPPDPTVAVEAVVLRVANRHSQVLSSLMRSPSNGPWRIESDRTDGVHLAGVRAVSAAARAGTGGQDPFFVRVLGLHHMVVRLAVAARPATVTERYSTVDAGNARLIGSALGLATSDDGGQ
jgi:hypothetical protein